MATTQNFKKGQIVRWTNNGSPIVFQGEIVQVRINQIVVAYHEDGMTLWKTFPIGKK